MGSGKSRLGFHIYPCPTKSDNVNLVPGVFQYYPSAASLNPQHGIRKWTDLSDDWVPPKIHRWLSPCFWVIVMR